MMKAICKFYDNCMKVILDSAKAERKISMGFIEQTLKNNVMDKLMSMKFKDPLTSENELRTYFDDIVTEIDNRFREMQIY
jgi:vacuolar-type H+-ATPase catalytic subunit A/Vma1